MKHPSSILITGASGGIGAALARSYAAPGIALALTGRNAERLRAVAQACASTGAEVETALLDVTDEPGLATWIEAIDRAHPLDLVFANAGITGGPAPDGSGESLAELRRMMRVNFDGACNTIHSVIPAMRRRRRGQIVLMSSLAALRGLPYFPAYCASKAALKIYGEALGTWLRGEGIEVSVVLPGFVETSMARRLHGPKPFQVTAERAARLIRRRLARGRRVVAFPFLPVLGARLLAAMPTFLADAVLASVKMDVDRDP